MNNEMQSDHVGTIRVPVSLLSFTPPAGFSLKGSQLMYRYEYMLRLDQNKIRRLAYIFQHGHCKPSEPNNQIYGITTLETLKVIVAASGLSWAEFRLSTSANNTPFVNGDFRIWCIHGRSRVAAAAIAFGQKAEWTVKLFCKSEGSGRELFIQTESEYFSHELPYSDGAIFRRIRQYSDDYQPEEIREWIMRLSDPKKKSLLYLLSCRLIMRALDGILPFTGLWNGLQLGNIHKHLALHCDENIVTYINHIRSTWSRIMGKHQDLAGLIDPETVRCLQFLAPAASTRDRKAIQSAMEQNRIFQYIPSDAIRQQLVQNVLELDVLIPSLETFHENMKYFSIGAKILGKHLEIKRPRSKIRTTVYENLLLHWKAPERNLIETGPNNYVAMQSPANPILAYLEIFLGALREFAKLSTETPLQAKRKAKMTASEDDSYLARFRSRAGALGFEVLESQKTFDFESSPKTIEPLELPEWRGGKPPVKVYEYLQHVSFLPNLKNMADTDELKEHLSALYVQADFVHAFFGPFDDQIQPEPQPDEVEIEMSSPPPRSPQLMKAAAEALNAFAWNPQHGGIIGLPRHKQRRRTAQKRAIRLKEARNPDEANQSPMPTNQLDDSNQAMKTAESPLQVSPILETRRSMLKRRQNSGDVYNRTIRAEAGPARPRKRLRNDRSDNFKTQRFVENIIEANREHALSGGISQQRTAGTGQDASVTSGPTKQESTGGEASSDISRKDLPPPAPLASQRQKRRTAVANKPPEGQSESTTTTNVNIQDTNNVTGEVSDDQGMLGSTPRRVATRTIPPQATLFQQHQINRRQGRVWEDFAAEENIQTIPNDFSSFNQSEDDESDGIT